MDVKVRVKAELVETGHAMTKDELREALNLGEKADSLRKALERGLKRSEFVMTSDGRYMLPN
jgi:hypothetical protein